MYLIDDHCHLDEFFYKDEVDSVIERARKNNVKAIICAGINPDTNRQVLKLQEKYPDIIYPALGMYPRDALRKEIEESENKIDLDYDVDKELAFIYSHKDKIVALGEVGMDFKDGKDFEQQEKDFRKIIELAIKMDKALVIHSRKAEAKVIEILESYKYKKIVMHCFGGNHKLVRKIRENQWLFSIPTSIVRDEHFQKIIKETPLNQILTETDAPFLSPFREKRNEPSFIIETIKIISKLRNTPEEDVANIIYTNAKRMFNIT
jgi:TatD DNase family protein